jgi:phage tail-like protein
VAQTRDYIKSAYPLPAYNYRVTVLNEGAATVIGFSQVTGLTVEYQPVTYKHGLSFAMGANIIPGMRQPIRLTLKKGLVKNNDFLQQWLGKSNAEPFSSGVKRDIQIDLCDEQGLAVISWTVIGALPVKLEGPTLEANSDQIAIASMELIAHDLRVDYHLP